MIAVKVDKTSALAVIQSLKKYGKDTEPRIKRAVQVGAYNILGEAVLNTPVVTGRLRASESIQWIGGGLAAKIGSNVEYAAKVESRRHFLENAYENNIDDFQDLIINALKGK